MEAIGDGRVIASVRALGSLVAVDGQAPHDVARRLLKTGGPRTEPRPLARPAVIGRQQLAAKQSVEAVGAR